MAIGELEVVELVVLACLMAEPQHCEEFHMPFLRPMVVFECMSKPPTLRIVQWANEHPLWTIKRWTCGSPRA
jgi:hypothetical protein